MENENEIFLEIAADEPEAKSEVTKFCFLHALLGTRDWKKDVKKIGYGLLAIVAVSLLVFAGVKILNNQLWSFRFHAPVEMVKYQKSVLSPDFSFVYPQRYVFDSDEQKKYGGDYLAGFHLKDDSRTGCDVRTSNIGINFSKSDKEINDAIYADLSANVKGFDGYTGKRIIIGKENAMESDFSLIDPLSEVLHMKQVMVTHEGKNYLLICGGSEDQYEFYQKDYQDFVSSFSWNR